MSEESDALAVLKRIELLLAALVKKQMSSILEQELSDDKKRELYLLTGKKTMRELVAQTNSSSATISGLWQRWESLGLLVKNGKKYVKVV